MSHDMFDAVGYKNENNLMISHQVVSKSGPDGIRVRDA